jgi:hypothetical protein
MSIWLAWMHRHKLFRLSVDGYGFEIPPSRFMPLLGFLYATSRFFTSYQLPALLLVFLHSPCQETTNYQRKKRKDRTDENNCPK